MTDTAQPRRTHALSDRSWHEQGACREADDTLFFHPDGETGSTKARRIADAKTVCESCPVLARCRDYALEANELFGIWGGLSEDERAAIHAGRSLDASNRLHLVPFQFASAHPPRVVEIELVIGHLNKLIDAGFNPSSIGKFAGVHPETVRTILRSDKKGVFPATAEKLLSVQVRAEVAA